MPEATTPTIPTNTITITNLEAGHFAKEIMLRLKAKAEDFGQVYYFAPIKSFYRVFVVYHSTFDAQRAKALLHNTSFEGTTIRVYFGQHTEISDDPATRYLHPPELEKNWLISPPGSPPVGWTQVREDPPNSLHLADDLVQALLDMGQPVYQLPRPDGSFADRSHLFETNVEHFSLDEPQKPSREAEGSKTDDDNDTNKDQEKLQHEILSLRIDTQRTLTPAQTSALQSVASPGSSLFPPSTPTVLAFSPSKESEGDQPFITVQDWGFDSPLPAPLKRRGTIPKTAFPTGPIRPSPSS
ncbi:carbohydrate-binding module 1 protein [Modicella reniformis]|uniref:Carbohydrate-binding module 1 protein n=1 Tax=Modicella reniformis TaxID=1440133 RepID=A0A9P6M896_9FUNG|nr:carbohydrate-binding module 1 protein [Modicella reniformis]